MIVVARRICWPNPDATCLAGGCLHCADYPRRTMRVIRRYADGAGVLPHRGRGGENAVSALNYGERHGFPNVETWEAER